MRSYEFIIEGVAQGGEFLYHVTNPLNLIDIIAEGKLSIEWAVDEPTISLTRDENYRVTTGSVAQIIFKRSVLESMFELEPYVYRHKDDAGNEYETDESEERVHGDVPFNNKLVSSVVLIGEITDSVSYNGGNKVITPAKETEKKILGGLEKLKIPVTRK